MCAQHVTVRLKMIRANMFTAKVGAAVLAFDTIGKKITIGVKMIRYASPSDFERAVENEKKWAHYLNTMNLVLDPKFPMNGLDWIREHGYYLNIDIPRDHKLGPSSESPYDFEIIQSYKTYRFGHAVIKNNRFAVWEET